MQNTVFKWVTDPLRDRILAVSRTPLMLRPAPPSAFPRSGRLLLAAVVSICIVIPAAISLRRLQAAALATSGAGLGAWPAVYPQFATFDIGLFVNQAHCDWLQWAAEGGVPLLLAYFSLTAQLLRPLLRSVWGIGFLTVLTHAAVNYPFHQLPTFTTLLFCAAFAASQHTSAS